MMDFKLSGKERVRLEEVIAHTRDARVAQRAYALLWLDKGDSLTEVAARLTVSRQSVYNWVALFQARTARTITERLTDAERSGRPRTAHGVIDPLLEAVVELDPRDLGYRSTVWTAAVLVQYLADAYHLRVSDDSVRLALARLEVRWKRPRHQLALRPATWRQAKGGSNGGFPAENARSS